jgi:hypothetical protein
MDDAPQYDLSKWFAGFFDGEGCISMAITERAHLTVGYELRPVMKIAHEQVAGTLDAEGWVGMTIASCETMRVGYELRPGVKVTEREHDRLMQALATYCTELGVTCNVRQLDRSDEPGTYYELTVAGQANTRRLLESIRDMVIVKREQVEIMLDEVIPRLERGVHHDRQGFVEVMGHVDRLNAHKGGSRGKYTQAYFAELWDIDPQAISSE